MSTDNYVFVYHKDYAEVVTKNFKSFLDSNLYIDLVFVCRNNKKVGAHQVVLGCLSKFFYSIFIENVNTTKEKVLHIYVPDIRAKIMKHILQFIYSGKAMLNKEELAEFNEDIKLLGMPLDHFSSPNEAVDEGERTTAVIALKTPENVAPPQVLRIVQDTVDLTESSLTKYEVPVIELSDGSASESIIQEKSVPFALPIKTETESTVPHNNLPGKKFPTVPEPRSESSDSITVSCNEKTNQISLDCQLPIVGANQDQKNVIPITPCRKRKKTIQSPSSQSKVLPACIDLDDDDDAEVITIS